MLSYMLPVEEKSPPRNLSLNLTLNNGTSTDGCEKNEAFINGERASALKSNLVQNYDNSTDGVENKENSVTNDSGTDQRNSSEQTDGVRKGKLMKIGNNKTIPLKRVSFGSSKGSMVETLVFETPTPLPEHAEREFGFPVDSVDSTADAKLSHSTPNASTCLDDSGIELQQEELERSKVRVSFYQCSRPQQISPQEIHLGFFDYGNNNTLTGDSQLTEEDINNMTTSIQTNYDRQTSTDSGWENPFRPGGDLSREADEIVNMIKGGKPITPTSDQQQIIVNGGGAQNENGEATVVVDGAKKLEISQMQSAVNGTKSPQKLGDKKNGDSSQVSNQIIPGPQSASHVVIDEKKKKKCACCVIQ